MEIRRIVPEERIVASKIQSIAFTAGRDFSSAKLEPEKFTRGYETGRAVFNDKGKMCSCLELIPFEVRFEEKNVNMAGIGGVASLPEERRKGYIRNLFRYCFDEMRRNEQWFSYLYPFSNTYYRQYGYEACYKKIRSIIPLASFKHFPNSGEIELYIPGMDDSGIKNIYNNFIADKNLPVFRNEKLWEKRIGEDPYKNNQYTYIWFNAEGNPGAFISFRTIMKEQYKADMQVQELAWMDGDSLLGILGFLNTFVPRYENLIWEHPAEMNIHLLFPEPYDVKTEVQSSGMNRIVDLKEVFMLMKHPENPGSFKVEVSDNFLEWNNGCFEVAWNNEGTEVIKRDCLPDLSCSIQTLTQLVTGYSDFNDLFFQGDVKIYGNQAVLFNFFKKRKLYINDYF